jgi:hypothetical protein
MFPIAVTLGYATGALIAISAKRSLQRAYDPLRTRYCAMTLLFGVAVLGPAAVAFYALYPDWSLMYLANPAHLSALVMMPLLFIVAAVSPVAGFAATYKLSTLESPRALRLSFALVWVALFAFFSIGGERLGAVAYYDAFHGGGERVALSGSPLLFAVIIAAIAATVWIFYGLILVKKHVDLSEHVPIDGGLGATVELPGASANLPR